MSRLALTLATILLALSSASCKSGPPTAQELAAADYGTPISKEEAVAKATKWFNRHLKDPGSAQYVWTFTGRAWMREPVINGGDIDFGYRLDAMVNAKNSYGGYTGQKAYSFLFNDSEIIAIYGQKELSGSYGSTPYMAKLK